jgi:hypothetical protein
MTRSTILALSLLLPAAAHAATQFADLGTAAPPAALGPIAVTAFDTVPQAAIPDFTDVSVIPGSPIPGDVGSSPDLNKRTVPASWASWSHGYTGPVFSTLLQPADKDPNTNAGAIGEGGGGTTRTLTLPAAATAFYLYVEPNSFDLFQVQVTTDTGGDSGPILVDGDGGAHGFGFWTDTMGETISTVTVTVLDNGFAIGELGISDIPVPVELQSFEVE